MAVTVFAKVKDKAKLKSFQEGLAYIVAQSQGAAGQVSVPLKIADEMLKAEPGLFDKLTAADALGNVIVRATAKGIEAVTGVAAGDATGVTTEFVVEDVAPIPEGGKRVGGGAPGVERYPFSKLDAVGKSFFIPATDARPNPFKSMGSTVNGANRRFKKAGQPNHFLIRKRNAGDPINPADPNGKRETANGARIYRNK
jgi:hypothetical protein